MGDTVTWCGWTFDVFCETVTLAAPKLAKLRHELLQLAKQSKVRRKELEATLGLLQWATTLSPHLRPFLAPLYKDLHSCKGTLHSINARNWQNFLDSLDGDARLTKTPLNTWLPRKAKLLEVGGLKIQSKKDVPLVPPSHKPQWIRLADPARGEVHLREDSRFALHWLHRSFAFEQSRPLRAHETLHCMSAADAMGDADIVGIGGWVATSTGFAWFSETWHMDEVRKVWPQLTLPAQRYIACFETLAQLALAHCTTQICHARSARFWLPSASDNTAAESGINRLFTTAEPLSTFIRLVATWAHTHRVSLSVEHLPGEKNAWADKLSRGKIDFLQHREGRVRFDLLGLASAQHTVSLCPAEAAWDTNLQAAQHGILDKAQ